MAQGFKMKSKAPAKKAKASQKQKQKPKQLSKGRKAFSAKGRKVALAKQDAETSKAINRKNEVEVAARAMGSGDRFFLSDIKVAGKKEIGKNKRQLRKKESKSIKMSERLTQQLNKLNKMMLPITSLATAAAGAVVVVLSGASMSNMYEMFSLANNSFALPTPVPSDVTTRAANWKSIDEAVHELQTMSRRDLISLYLDCEHPDITELAATNEQTKDNWVYDGYLLSNGPILTTITNFITNKLFGRGLQWMGKAYFSSNSAVPIGKNRFRLEQNGEQETTKGILPDVLLDRTFDYYIGQSALCSSSSLINRYSPHCSKWSPMSLIWRGMVDELRVIPLSVDAACSSDQTQTQKGGKNKAMLLLGMGYFTWSGGAWNSAPFCLVAKQGK